MTNKFHATFVNAENATLAARSLLMLGVCAEDIHLILPQPRSAKPEQAATAAECVDSSEKPSSKKIAPALYNHTAITPNAGLPKPPQLPPLPPRNCMQHNGSEESMAPGAPGYTYDALGAVNSDPALAEDLVSPSADASEVILDLEQGAGVGLGLGLVTALCIPGVGMIAGSGAIIAGLMAAGAVAGGVAGGIYGYFMDRGMAKETARVMSDHINAGGSVMIVTVSRTIKTAEVARAIEFFEGQLIGR